jgi:hypothetical protein
MWELKDEKDGVRTYFNAETGSICKQTKCYTDKDGNTWHQFNDLMQLPYTRNAMASRIVSLYSLGLSKEDLTGHINGMKTILKSTDPEKYEKAFANLLDFENKANSATDAIKQISSLVCVYFTMNDEPIDGWDNSLQIKKMALLEADTDMHHFFLKRQIEITERYTQSLNLLSQIVSPTESINS